MKYIATIEIPKNSPRRIHKTMQDDEAGRYRKGDFFDFGPISEKITANNGLMPLVYGFIENTTGSDGEGDEVDVMVFSEKEYNTGDSFDVTPFAMMMREDGDFKVLAHDDTMQINSWDEVPTDMQKTLMEFNGFKLPIVEVKNAEETIKYLESVKTS